MASYLGNKHPVMAALLLLVVVAMMDHISYTVAARELSSGDEVMKVRHEKWMAKHGRTYRDNAEKALRFEVFKSNAEFIDRSNAAGGKKYHLATNQFSDLTSKEFAAKYTGLKPVPPSGGNSKKVAGFKYENVTLSDDQQSVDWRQQGAVTGIKDQGQCGCCWAFSTVGALEGFNKIQTGQLVSLSEQQLLDCDKNDGNNGCNGGFMDKAFQYIINSGGIATEADYPYTAVEGTCRQSAMQPAVTIRGFQSVPKGNEDALAAAVANQPVSVGVDGKGPSFQSYRGGVLTGDACGREMNHAVTAIGYGTEQDGTPYWLLKNQWEETWGEGGYMKLERGTGACGIGNMASYPSE